MIRAVTALIITRIILVPESLEELGRYRAVAVDEILDNQKKEAVCDTGCFFTSISYYQLIAHYEYGQPTNRLYF